MARRPGATVYRCPLVLAFSSAPRIDVSLNDLPFIHTEASHAREAIFTTPFHNCIFLKPLLWKPCYKSEFKPIQTGSIARHRYFKSVDIKGDDTDKRSLKARTNGHLYTVAPGLLAIWYHRQSNHRTYFRYQIECCFSHLHSKKSEWVSDCCLTPIQQFFSYIRRWHR
jgi:hypothetical protein